MGSSAHRHGRRKLNLKESGITRREAVAFTAFRLAAAPGFALAAGPEGQLTWGVHISLAPIWFDPADISGIITPFMVLYALHDAIVKPMPEQPLAPSLAESWSASEDGLSYEFTLREGAKFHNADPVTADDVKFTFERYRGTARDLMKDRVAAVESLDPRHVRFRLKEPWPDFLTFYGSASGAGWIVPKRYVEKVGDEGFKKAPIGAGPYKFVSFSPDVELVLDAFEPYWRKPPAVKRLIFKVIPDETTRLAALKRGEVDIAYSVRGELAEELQRTPGLTLKPAVVQGVFNIYFADQWEAKSPWHDERVRRAASLAIDREGTNQALTLGYSLVTGNPVVADNYEFFWQPPAPVYDPEKAKELLAIVLAFRHITERGQQRKGRSDTRPPVVSPHLMTEGYYDENCPLLLWCLASRSVRRSGCCRRLPLWRVSASNRLGVRRGCLLQEGACSRRRAFQNLCPRWAGGSKAQKSLLPDMRNDSVLGG